MVHKLLPIAAMALALGQPRFALAQGCPAGASPRCAELAAARDSERLAAEQLIKSAESNRGDKARALYRKAGDAYLVIWQTYYADPCRGSERDACSRAEEVLYNASRAFSAGADLAKASQIRRTLIEPQFHLEKTSVGLKALYQEGAAHQAIAEYEEAAEWYERFAEDAPRDEKAPEALLDAVVLRLGLHQQAAAEKNADAWVKSFSTKQPDSHAKLVVAIAQSKRDAGAPAREMEKYLLARRPLVARAGSEHQPAVDVMLGTAIAARGDVKGARPHFERAAAFEVLPLIKRLSSEDQAIADRRLAKALIGIGDADLWLADRARDEAMKLKLDKATPESLQRKRDAVTEAEKLYGKVLAIQPMPPPIATVEAAARVARMRGQLWAQAHLAFGAATADVMLTEAKASYRNCLDLAVKLQAQTPAVGDCAKWLERHYREEVRPLTELMPKPKWSATRFGGPRPLDDDGEEGALPTVEEPGRPKRDAR